jgi:succinate dehydrogenase/fumarate reductase-like Fe-S protein
MVRGVSSRLAALSYLGYRAILAHPLKRLRQRGTGLERFLASYSGDGLAPTSVDDRRLGEEASRCIACGLCEPACELAAAAPAVRALGLHAAFRLYSRSNSGLPLAADALAACAPCATSACEAACPTAVPIARIVRRLAERTVHAAPSAVDHRSALST